MTVTNYQDVLDSYLCTSDPDGMDELDARLMETGLDNLAANIGELGSLLGNECILAGTPLGGKRHEMMTTWLSLAASLQQVLGDLRGLIECDVYDEAAIVV